MSTPDSDICFQTATDLVRNLRSKKLSAAEILTAHLNQIERVNPKVNAIVTLVADQAMEQACAADRSLARGEWLGPLHGLPVAHKDLHNTEGIRTTYGSPLFEAQVPTENAPIVERIQKAGAITVGKTNTPEFGAGSQTFNPVFGATRNPYDLSKTCGGSSGGAAVALACGMAPLAEGSDMGGSLRNPASFCNVVGLRPSPGRVPNGPSVASPALSVSGPMARTVADTALLLSVIADSGDIFARPLDRDFNGVRIAWAKDLGGLPFDHRIREVVEAHRRTFEALGCIVENAEPDFEGADETFKTLRASSFAMQLGNLDRARLKDTILGEIERGAKLTGPQLERAELKRRQLQDRARTFMQTYEFFVLPVTQVPPFDLNQQYVTEINGVKMESYIDWMKSCYFISVLGNPAISVPCGFTPDGLPVGIQIVGRHHGEWPLLQLAYAFEQATGFGKRQPAL
ncbi:MAG: amidase [Bryobacteraceae bacterium]